MPSEEGKRIAAVSALWRNQPESALQRMMAAAIAASDNQASCNDFFAETIAACRSDTDPFLWSVVGATIDTALVAAAHVHGADAPQLNELQWKACRAWSALARHPWAKIWSVIHHVLPAHPTATALRVARLAQWADIPAHRLEWPQSAPSAPARGRGRWMPGCDVTWVVGPHGESMLSIRAPDDPASDALARMAVASIARVISNGDAHALQDLTAQWATFGQAHLVVPPHQIEAVFNLAASCSASDRG